MLVLRQEANVQVLPVLELTLQCLVLQSCHLLHLSDDLHDSRKLNLRTRDQLIEVNDGFFVEFLARNETFLDEVENEFVNLLERRIFGLCLSNHFAFETSVRRRLQVVVAHQRGLRLTLVKVCLLALFSHAALVPLPRLLDYLVDQVVVQPDCVAQQQADVSVAVFAELAVEKRIRVYFPF